MRNIHDSLGSNGANQARYEACYSRSFGSHDSRRLLSNRSRFTSSCSRSSKDSSRSLMQSCSSYNRSICLNMFRATGRRYSSSLVSGSKRAALSPQSSLSSPLLALRIRPGTLSTFSARSSLHSSTRLLLDTERPSPRSSSNSDPFPPSASSLSSASSSRSRRLQPSSSSTTTTSTSSSSSPPPQPLSPPPLSARLTKKRITSVTELPKTFGQNQIIAVPDEVKQELEQVLLDFKAPVRFAFAYGSGVFRQKGYAASDQPMLDFVFAVSHPSHWHAINMHQNPHHYSLPMRLLGSDAVAWMQEKGLGAEVWFNVDVQVKGKTLKYGVISIDALCRDMLDWETLYISGRTQKPVRILKDDARVRLANQVNLASALRTALLRLPEDFTEIELFEEIAGLSYRGDFRMKVGENPLKVRNIVAAQLNAFRSLYGGLLKSFWKSVHVIGERPHEGGEGFVRLMRQDRSESQRASIAQRLPIGLKSKLMAHYERKLNLKTALGNGQEQMQKQGKSEQEIKESKEDEERVIWQRIVEDEEFDSMLDKSLAQIVGRPTFNQSLKGILSAGPLKSLRYIGPKLKKKWSKQPSALPTPVSSDKPTQ